MELAAIRGEPARPVALPDRLLVVCAGQTVARWCATPIDLGHPGLTLIPLVLGPAEAPLITDVAEARDRLELAVLSAIVHARHADRGRVFAALAECLAPVDNALSEHYLDIVFAALATEARHQTEAVMTTVTHKYKSDFARRYFDTGAARGEANAVLEVLDERGIVVPDDARARIADCADLVQLTRWLRRAVTAASVDDLFA